MLFKKYPKLEKIIVNISWLFFDKILRMGIGLFVVMWLARYLGPAEFGLLNFVIALVSIFGVFSTLGLKGIVVRDLIDHAESEKEILGTTFILRLFSGIFVYLLLLSTIFIIKPDDTLSKILVAIYGASLIFKSVEVIAFWFESQVTYKYVVWVENTTFMILSLVKVIMIWLEADLVQFAWVMLLESVIVAVALLIVYSKLASSPKNWQVTITKARALLKNCWPLIISSAAWIIYTRVDQIMIGEMLDLSAVGQYSVAIKISEMVNFVPMIIVFSIIPIISKSRKNDRELYLKQFQMTYDLVVGLMLLTAFIFTFMSTWLVQLLFGSEYMSAASALSIHIWSTIFIAMATVSGKFLLNEGLQKITMQRHLLGIFINIPLNYFLIPVYGIEGAAWASLASFALCNYFYDALTSSTRICFVQKSKSIVAYSAIAFLWRKLHAVK